MKIEVFREMYELNEAFERIIEGIRRLEEFSFLCHELVQDTRAEAVVLQVETNEFFFDRTAGSADRLAEASTPPSIPGRKKKRLSRGIS